MERFEKMPDVRRVEKDHEKESLRGMHKSDVRRGLNLMKKNKIFHVVAMSKNRVIGKDNKLQLIRTTKGMPFIRS
jgi:hypothetical protein